MKWTTHRREHGLVEHICQHGVGHPNHGSALWIAEAWFKKLTEAGDEPELDSLYRAELIHGCDGCCGRDDFPGTLFDSLRHAHELIRDRNKAVAELSHFIHHQLGVGYETIQELAEGED